MRGNYKSKICIQYSTDNVGFTYKTYRETLYCIDFPTISINFIRICGDFPVTFKVITCNAYLFFFIQYLLVYISEKLWGFQTMCNPHPNYMHITGYPVRHGDSLHFLWGKHLQCRNLQERVRKFWNIIIIFTNVQIYVKGICK